MGIKNIDNLKKLDFTKQLAFAYLTCERLYPNYVFFSKNYEFGDPNLLRTAIDYIYSNLFESNFNKAKIDSLIGKINNVTPIPADYETVLASSALDACGVIYEALNFLSDKQPSHLKEISTIAIDSADMYIQEKEQLDFNTDADFQQKIDDHPLMIKEIQMQEGIISYLSNIENLEYSDVDTLIKLQENNKGSLNLQ